MKTQLLVTLDDYLFDFVCDTFQSIPETEDLSADILCVKVHRTSMLGRFITLSLPANHKHSLRQVNGYFELYIESAKNKIPLTVHRKFNRLNQELNESINYFFQNIFQNSFIYFVNGYRNGYTSNTPGEMRNAIREWIDKYNLYEHDFSFCKLEQIYLRAQRRKPLTKLIMKRK